MKALEAVPDAALLHLVLATNGPGPRPELVKRCPRFWQYLGDVVAVEVAHRKGVSDVDEPLFPLHLGSEELETAAQVLVAMASAAATRDGATAEDEALARGLHDVAGGLLDILRERLVAACPAH